MKTLDIKAEAAKRREQIWRVIEAHEKRHACKAEDRCPITRALQQGSIALLEIVECEPTVTEPNEWQRRADALGQGGQS